MKKENLLMGGKLEKNTSVHVVESMTVGNTKTDKIDQQDNLRESVVDFNHVKNLVNKF